MEDEEVKQWKESKSDQLELFNMILLYKQLIQMSQLRSKL